MAVFTAIHFVRNLRIGPICLSVYPLQGFLDNCNLILLSSWAHLYEENEVLVNKQVLHYSRLKLLVRQTLAYGKHKLRKK